MEVAAPVIGKVVDSTCSANSLALFQPNGVPVLTARRSLNKSFEPILKQAILRAKGDGRPASQPLGRSKIFPQLIVDLVRSRGTEDVPGARTSPTPMKMN
jgi:hypothetical protein